MLTSLSDEIVPTQSLDDRTRGAALASAQREARASKENILSNVGTSNNFASPSYTTSYSCEGLGGPVEARSDRGRRNTGTVDCLRVPEKLPVGKNNVHKDNTTGRLYATLAECFGMCGAT